jgi:Tol biopolymer transport system component
MRTRSARRSAALAALLSLCGAMATVPAHGQYFGRNKVQWEEFDFHVMETEHFRIHHYPEGNPAIADAGQMAERWYQRLSATFGHQFDEKKPIVLYNDHADFQQTGTTGGLIGEGTGGFTEPLQDRVVLPLTPTYADSDHVIGHELVHAFQFDIAERQARREDGTTRGAPGLMQLPLWLVEGLAEYLSQGRVDTLTATWLRDAVLHDDLPDLEEMSRDLRYNPYQYGQAVWAYIGGRYGDRRAVELFRSALQIGPERAFEEALGLDWEQFAEEWHADLKEHYQPLLAQRQAPDAVGRELIGRQEGGRLAIAPALSPDGRWLAFLSTRGLFSIDLYLADARTGEVVRRLASEDSDPHIDALRFIDSAGSWSPDGRQFAFSVISRGDNRIVVVDVESGDIRRRIEPAGVGEITNIAWSPDGRTLAFSGMANGLSDIYLLELDGEQVRRLTNDRHGDLQPAWSRDGRSLVFVSDRGEGVDPDDLGYAPLGLFRLDVASGAVTALPRLAGGRQIDPHFSADGNWIYFLADPDGFTDVYRMPAAGGPAERLTQVATGVGGITEKSPALSVSADAIVFSVFDGRDLALRSVPIDTAPAAVPSEPSRLAAVLPPAEPRRDVVVTEYLTPGQGPAPPPESFDLEPYDAKLRLANIGPVSVGLVSDDYGYGVGGGATAYFSDVLGRHELAVALQGGSTTGDFAEAIALQALYLNREERFNWGVGGAHLPYRSAITFVTREPVEVNGQIVTADVIEQQRELVTLDQVSLIGQYPLAQTRRFEASAGYTHYDFEAEVERIVVVGNTILDRDTFDLGAPDALALQNVGIAYVGDNSSFGFVSPVRGGRMRLELEQTTGDLDFSTALADLRKYFWLRPVTVAMRGMHFGRYGDDSESGRLSPLYVGRQTLVRGYAVGDIDPSECTTTPGSDSCPEFDRLIGSRMAVVNLEARFPLFGVEDFGLVELPSLPTELGVFLDGGVAWSSGDSPELRFDEETPDRVPVWSAGVTLRMLLLGALPLEFYYAKPFQRPQEDWVFGFNIAPGW